MWGEAPFRRSKLRPYAAALRRRRETRSVATERWQNRGFRPGIAGVAACVLVLLTTPPAMASGWRLQSIPYQSTSSRGLDGVSCVSSRFCIGVGFDRDSDATLAARWDGARWTTQPTPATGNAVRGVGSMLNAVSCISTSFCVAVGSTNSRNRWTLIDRWDGAHWASQRHPTLPRFSGLLGVSCRSARFCIAVGGPTGGDLGPSLAELWNGTSWTRSRTPNYPGADQTTLDALSCLSTRNCTAVGSWYSSRTGSGGTVAERWNGVRWTIHPTPASGDLSELAGVSCLSASFCMAVGGPPAGDTGPGLADRWNGRDWTRIRVPAGTLNGVSCRSARLCTAVGTKGGRTLAEHWNGTAWAIQRTPNPRRPPQTLLDWSVSLSGVSCTSANACYAVGTIEYEPGGSVSAYIPVAEQRS